MDEECKVDDSHLPTEMDGVKFKCGWYYVVDKESLEPYIREEEKDTNYRSITITIDCSTFKFTKEIEYSAVFFTNIKKVGISGTLCEVAGSQEDQNELKEKFLKKLHKILSSLKLKPDLEMLAKREKRLEDKFRSIIQEMKEIDALFNK